MLERVEAPAWIETTARLGDALRELGHSPRRVAQALGIIAWNGRDLDGAWWRRACCADGPEGDRVELLVRGTTIPAARARAALPPEAWASGAVEDVDGGARATGTILPLERDLVWTDRGDRAFVGDDGLFLPDSTTLAVRRCLPADNVERHLDLGAGGGAVLARAARSARRTFALDLNPRAAEGCHRTAALSRLDGVETWTGLAGDAPSLGSFDRVSFVLPLLVPWTDLAAGPVHTIARTSELLAEIVELLPRLLAPGGLAVLYAQEWVGGAEIPEALDAAFHGRAWRGTFWWDHEGSTAVGPLRAGILAIRADAGAGWSEGPLDAPDVGVDDWWPLLSGRLTAPTPPR